MRAKRLYFSTVEADKKGVKGIGKKLRSIEGNGIKRIALIGVAVFVAVILVYVFVVRSDRDPSERTIDEMDAAEAVVGVSSEEVEKILADDSLSDEQRVATLRYLAGVQATDGKYSESARTLETALRVRESLELYALVTEKYVLGDNQAEAESAVARAKSYAAQLPDTRSDTEKENDAAAVASIERLVTSVPSENEARPESYEGPDGG